MGNTDDRLVLTYIVTADAAAVEERARALLFEQAIELPSDELCPPHIREAIVGEVVSIEEQSPGSFRVRIGHPLATTALEAGQLLNVAFGNSSLQPDIALEDIALACPSANPFGGPRFGTAGIRALLGCGSRALTCTALKPMGISPLEAADLCERFARAGIDLIKDDHGLGDHTFCRFGDRVRACQEAVARANAATGGRSVYVPNLIGSPRKIGAKIEIVREQHIACVMTEPSVIGLPFFHELVSGSLGVPVLAHPAWAGAARVSPVALLGRLYRWFGADAVIFPHSGGRFSYSEDVCTRLADALRGDGDGMAAALPVPAGGIKTPRVREVLDFYGNDVILLIGGSLLEAGERLPEVAREFVDTVVAVSAQRETGGGR